MRRPVADYARTAMLRREWPFCAAPARTCRAAPTKTSMKAMMWRYRDSTGRHQITSFGIAQATRNRLAATQQAAAGLHVRVVWPAAAFGGNPVDILVGILDVARFAVDAVLRIDYEFRCARFFHPFIDAGWAVPRRGAGEHIVFGLFLQPKIGNAQVDRLIFFVIGIGQ